ncbi:MAG: helix-turn-helix transcriptional regulator [Clostridia bacterium]|nr:helix-turn-helix transcriptional regulator [Clostridia bacterium]
MNRSGAVPLLQLVRTDNRLIVRYIHPVLAQRVHLRVSAGEPVPPELSRLLLPEMAACTCASHTGLFYGGSVHQPVCFCFELGSEVFSLVAVPCTAAQAAQRFLSCPAPDLSGDSCTAVLLHRQNGIYQADHAAALNPAARHLIRQCACLFGRDFPDICFSRGEPVCFLHLHRRKGWCCEKIHLMPLCTATHQVLVMRQPIPLRAALNLLCRNVSPQTPLTRRERQALALAGEGWTNRAIAGTMGIQEGTVKKLLSAAYEKAGIASRYELLRRLDDR